MYIIYNQILFFSSSYLMDQLLLLIQVIHYIQHHLKNNYYTALKEAKQNYEEHAQDANTLYYKMKANAGLKLDQDRLLADNNPDESERKKEYEIALKEYDDELKNARTLYETKLSLVERINKINVDKTWKPLKKWILDNSTLPSID